MGESICKEGFDLPKDLKNFRRKDPFFMKKSKKVPNPNSSDLQGWSISEDSGIVSGPEDKELYLEPRLAKLFQELRLNANQLVSRKQLIEQIWQDTTVNEESLTRAVSDLRQILAGYFDHPPPIVTVPKRGYKMEISIPSDKKSVWGVVLKGVLYTVLGFILLVLVIRGLNY